MSDYRLFKLIVKNNGAPSLKGLNYIYNNIDIINQMGIKMRITVIDEEGLDRETVSNFNSKGITSFPAMITDNGKIRNGYREIEELFEKNKQNYAQWVDQQNMQQRGGGGGRAGEYGPEYDFGGGGVAEYFAREMNFDAYQRDNKNNDDDDGDNGRVSEDYNRRIAEQMGRRKTEKPLPQNRSSAGGGDPNEDFDFDRSGRRQGLPEPGNNIIPRGGMDMVDAKFMEGVDDSNYEMFNGEN